ncbi:transmembrane protein 179B-like [Narcine bancroftii]|uniref:transmembrane protein 179B-like n=1 Tax=Narcine bancroftii TaxID=1343680 RepID=UPI003831BBB0
MANSLLLLLELLLLGAAFVCGIVTAALVTGTQGDFGGSCILYGEARWNADAQSLDVAAFGSSSHCAFVDILSVLISIYCFCTTFYYIYTYFMDETTRNVQCLTASLVVSGANLILLLTCGCLIRVGFSTFCQSVIHETKIKSCSEAEKLNWTSPFDGSTFSRNFSSAETSTWVNFFLWALVLPLLVIQRSRGARVRLFSAEDPEWSTAVSGGAGRVSETDHLIPSGPNSR